MVSCVLFVCTQKTAYELRISDWSSDVCSSDRITSATTMKAEGAPAATTLITSQICSAAKARRAAAACHVIRRPRLRAGGTLTAVRLHRRGPNADALLQPPRLAIPRTARFAPKIPKSRQLARDSLIFALDSARIRNPIAPNRKKCCNIGIKRRRSGGQTGGRGRDCRSVLWRHRQRLGIGLAGGGRRAGRLAIGLAFEP